MILKYQSLLYDYFGNFGIGIYDWPRSSMIHDSLINTERMDGVSNLCVEVGWNHHIRCFRRHPPAGCSGERK